MLLIFRLMRSARIMICSFACQIFESFHSSGRIENNRRTAPVQILAAKLQNIRILVIIDWKRPAVLHSRTFISYLYGNFFCGDFKNLIHRKVLLFTSFCIYSYYHNFVQLCKLQIIKTWIFSHCFKFFLLFYLKFSLFFLFYMV